MNSAVLENIKVIVLHIFLKHYKIINKTMNIDL